MGNRPDGWIACGYIVVEAWYSRALEESASYYLHAMIDNPPSSPLTSIGTGSVTLSGLMSALRNAGSSIKDARVLCVGAGSAGLGVCNQIRAGMVEGGLVGDYAAISLINLSDVLTIGRGLP